MESLATAAGGPVALRGCQLLGDLLFHRYCSGFCRGPSDLTRKQRLIFRLNLSGVLVHRARCGICRVCLLTLEVFGFEPVTPGLWRFACSGAAPGVGVPVCLLGWSGDAMSPVSSEKEGAALLQEGSCPYTLGLLSMEHSNRRLF